MNAPAFATAGGKTYSTDASATDKMVLKGTRKLSGHDNIGQWTSTIFMYELGSSGIQVHLYIVQYESFVVFEQVSTFFIVICSSENLIIIFCFTFCQTVTFEMLLKFEK